MHILVNAETIQKAQEGDQEVIGTLYEEYHPSIFRYLYYKVGDFHTAEDLASEVFLRMIRSICQFRPNSISFQAWLFQIAHNLAIDHYRAQQVRNHVPLEDYVAASWETPDKALELQLDSEHLRMALSRLPEEQRDVVILRFIAGMPIQEVAQALHKSEDSIKGFQRRALINLRQSFAQEGNPHD